MFSKDIKKYEQAEAFLRKVANDKYFADVEAALKNFNWEKDTFKGPNLLERVDKGNPSSRKKYWQ